MGQSLKELDKWTIQWLRERELGQRFTIRHQPSRDTLWKTLYSRFHVQSMWHPNDTVDDTHHGAVFNFDFSTDGSVLAAACEQKSLLLFDPLNGKLIHTRNAAHTDCVNCVKFLDSRLFASCSDDTSIALWDCRYLKNRVRTLQGHSNWVKNIEYSHDDGMLLTSGFDGSIFLWDINKYSEQNEGNCVFHMNGLMRSKLTPDASKLVISTTGGYLIVIHDLNLNTLSHDLQGFRPNMYRLMQMSGQPIRQGYQFNHLFERKRNRVEFISDFPTGNDAEVIASLQVHPQGWCVLSRNTSGDENTEFTSVHDIQTIPKDSNNERTTTEQPPETRPEPQSTPSGSTPTRGHGSVVINIRVEETDDPNEAGTVQIRPVHGRQNSGDIETIPLHPRVPEPIPSTSGGNLETVLTNRELTPDEPMEVAPSGDQETDREPVLSGSSEEDLETVRVQSMFRDANREQESRTDLYQIGDTSPRSDSDNRQQSPRSDAGNRQQSPRRDSDNRQQSPRSDSGNRQQSPRSDSDNRQQSPRSDSDNRQQSPRSDSGYRQQSPRSDSGYRQQPTRSDSDNRQQSPRSDSDNRQQSPRSDSDSIQQPQRSDTDHREQSLMRQSESMEDISNEPVGEEPTNASNTNESDPVMSYAFINIGVTYGEENSSQPSASNRQPRASNRQISASNRQVSASDFHSSDSSSSEDSSNSSNVQVSASNVQESASNVQESASNVQENASNVQESASNVQENTSNVQENVSNVQENASNVQESASNVQENASNVQESASNVQENVSNVQDSASNVHENASNVQESASNVQENALNVQESASNVQENASNVQESTSNVQESASNAQESASNAYESASNAQESASNAQESESNVQESASNEQESASNVQENASNVQESASNVQENASNVQVSVRESATNTTDSDSDSSDNEESARTSHEQRGLNRTSSTRHQIIPARQRTLGSQTFGRGRISIGDLQAGPFRQQLQSLTGPNRETVTYVIRSGANVAEQTMLLLNQGQSSRPRVPSGARIHQNTPRLTHYISEPNVGRGFIKELCFNSDGRLICSPFGFSVRLLAFDPDLRELCDCTLDQPVVLYEVNSHINHASYVVSTKFSPVHSLFVTGSMEGKVAFYQPRL
ncbi:unnamed protein product [Owenia fusiformis]|uniref:Uncharacterized protein n=1 Tax=Owenia fusiformis TaxID=6347 RepID=A0A8J1TLZ4_OWEFU|nr:unnamed protein product [Owenia fusiformis]